MTRLNFLVEGHVPFVRVTLKTEPSANHGSGRLSASLGVFSARLIAGDLYDFYWNNAGHSQIATNFLHQAIDLEHSHAVFPGFEQSPGVDLPLNSASTECQYPVNDQSFQQKRFALATASIEFWESGSS